MGFFTRRPDINKPKKNRISQSQASVFDVVWLTVKLLFLRIQFWIVPNFWTIIFSLGFFTAPAAKAALYHTVAIGLRDPGGSRVKALTEMKIGFKYYFWKALLISIYKWLVLIIIAFSVYFWLGWETWALRAVSVVSFYAFSLWWMSSGYLYPVLVDNPELSAWQVLKTAFLLAFKKPFQSLFFAIVDTILLILGLALFGPIMIIIPAFRSILLMQGYWYLTGREIPGFMEIYEYVNKHNEM